ncbi:MAG: DNA polymerase III subunit chi [Parachlamydiaceae bacterium]|nr:DNA polymerase III subunit chi [Parachlamydiaceae bacterium]
MNEEIVKKVHLLRVTDVATKLNNICQTIHRHFNKKEAILILVPSQEAAVYIDQLLWRQPNDSFLPHAVANLPTQELVAITTTGTNVNQAVAILNLCPEIPVNLKEYSIIYDLLDLTHPAKEQLSLNRQLAYQMLGYVLVSH